MKSLLEKLKNRDKKTLIGVGIAAALVLVIAVIVILWAAGIIGDDASETSDSVSENSFESTTDVSENESDSLKEESVDESSDISEDESAENSFDESSAESEGESSDESDDSSEDESNEESDISDESSENAESSEDEESSENIETPSSSEDSSEEESSEYYEESSEEESSEYIETPSIPAESSEEESSEYFEESSEEESSEYIETPSIPTESSEDASSEYFEDSSEEESSEYIETPSIPEDSSEEESSDSVEDSSEPEDESSEPYDPNAEGGENNPYLEIPDGETMTLTTVSIPANSSRFYSIYRVGGMILTINDRDAYVVYEGKTYTAKNGKVSFEIENALASDAILFEIGNSGSAAESFEIEFSNKKGSMENPEKLKKLEEITISLAAGEERGYFYRYICEKSGTLRFYMTASVDSVLMATNNRNSAQRSTEADVLTDENGNEYIELEVESGDEIIINVGAIRTGRGKYPATEIIWEAKYN